MFSVFEVVMFRMEVNVGVPLMGVYLPVAPPGRPVTVKPTDGSPVVDDPETRAMLTEYVLDPVVNTSKVEGVGVKVKS